MPPRGIPRDVESFIHEQLTSVAQLEILLLLHADPEKQLTPSEVAEQLRIDPVWAASELDRLRGAGVLDTADHGAYCYAPRTPELAGAIDGLAKAFSTHRVSVITMIFATPSDSVGSFADAFKLKRDDDG